MIITNPGGGGGGEDNLFTRGTSFPGSPSTDDLFWLNGDGMYEYDGTRWLSDNEQDIQWSCGNSGPYTGNQSSIVGGIVRLDGGGGGGHPTGSVYITRCEWECSKAPGTVPSLQQELRITVSGVTQDHSIGGAYYGSFDIGLALTLPSVNGVYARYIYSATGQAPAKLWGRIFYRRVGV